MKILAYLFLIIWSCCSYDPKDFEFTAKDLDHFSSFIPGDTIYYENSNQDIDTILILGFKIEQSTNCGGFMAPKPNNGKWIEIKHLPIDKWHGTIIDQGKSEEIMFQDLFSIFKYPTERRTEFGISFKDFHSYSDSIIGEFHKDTICLNRKKIANFYKVKHSYPERVTDSSNIEYLYWNEREGLIAYMNKGGLIWVKKATANSR